MSNNLRAGFWGRFEIAWNAHDANAVAALFADTASLRFVDGREFKGRGAIEAFYKETFATMPGDWIHRIASEKPSPSGSSGVLTIMNQQNETTISICYDLVLADDRTILSLNLTQS